MIYITISFNVIIKYVHLLCDIKRKYFLICNSLFLHQLFLLVEDLNLHYHAFSTEDIFQVFLNNSKQIKIVFPRIHYSSFRICANRHVIIQFHISFICANWKWCEITLRKHRASVCMNSNVHSGGICSRCLWRNSSLLLISS